MKGLMQSNKNPGTPHKPVVMVMRIYRQKAASLDLPSDEYRKNAKCINKNQSYIKAK